MKILLLHPEDTLDVGLWSRSSWDFIIDLGWSGRAEYSRQAQSFGRILSVYDLFEGQLHGDRLRELLALGFNRLLDSHSIDWWDAYSAFAYPKLEQLLLCSALARAIGDAVARSNEAEICATRAHSCLPAISRLLNRGVKILNPNPVSSGPLRALKSAARLGLPQFMEIAFDKWDIDYRLRRYFAPRQKPSSQPVVLLPSSYSNVSRTQIAFARMIPNCRFLLVFTRRNGLLPNLPTNVESRSLASYASATPATHKEFLHLIPLGHELLRELSESNSIFRLANHTHAFAGFDHFLRTGLRIRDAWLQVLSREPILSVLSADENNPYTRLPVLLAKQKSLRSVFCDHGALTMSFAVRPAISDLYLMRSEMALDYCIGPRKIPAEKALLGGPSSPTRNEALPSQSTRDRIVFYSEAYELYSSRTRIFYAELLPQLCRLARLTNRKVIIKLHPFESERSRTAIINDVLSASDRSLVEIRTGPMTPDLFSRAWCSFTVESSAAVESTVAGVPCFLCHWFDASWYEYAKQFAKFGAGYLLDSPDQIQQIPQILQNLQISDATRRGLQSVIAPELLHSILLGSPLPAQPPQLQK